MPADVLAVIEVLKAVKTGGDILDHAQLTPTKCYEVVPQISAYPKCPSGSPPGTLFPQFRLSICEPVEADQVLLYLDDWAGKSRSLYAVTRDNPSGDNLFTWIPLGDYGIIFTGEDGSGMLFTVANGRIVGAVGGCGGLPAYFLDKLPHTEVLLGPLPAN